MRRTILPPLIFLGSVIVLIGLFLFLERPPRRASAAPQTAGIETKTVSTAPVELPPARKVSDRGLRPEGTKNIAAVIMDDLGNSLELVRRLAGLKRPVTASILPYAPRSADSARLARGLGLEVMLHLPLESLFKPAGRNPAGMISAGMSREDIEANVRACLAEVPGATGANNHEGSKITEDEKAMSDILGVLAAERLFFIDSRTTGKSVAEDLARRLGVPAASRQVFLDIDPKEGAIRARLEELFKVARRRGRAVGICHPREETFRALEKYLRLADAEDVELVFASAVVR